MTSKAELFGAALGKAIRKTADKLKEDAPAPKMYRTNLRDVPKVEGLPRDDGWVDMQVQFLIDKKSAGANFRSAVSRSTAGLVKRKRRAAA